MRVNLTPTLNIEHIFTLQLKCDYTDVELLILTDELLPTKEDVIEKPNQKRGDLPTNRKCCRLCQRPSRKKTRYSCSKCNLVICSDHQKKDILCF